MNTIVRLFNEFKHAKCLEDILHSFDPYAEMLFTRVCPPHVSLTRKCDDAARLYEQKLRIAAGIAGDLPEESPTYGTIFKAIVAAGDLKTIYYMRGDAVEFINEAKHTLKLTPDHFIDNFSKPVVVYVDDNRPIVDDIVAVLVYYNDETKILSCIYSFRTPQGSREVGKEFYLEDLCGKLSKEMVSIDVTSSNTAQFLLEEGYVKELDDVNDKMYKSMDFVLKFVLMMQADKQILDIHRTYKEFKDKKKERESRGLVSHQTVALTQRYRIHMDRCRTDSQVVVLDKEGKILKTTMVTGFIRQQHYGPGNTLVKTIFIEPHETHVWINEGLRITKVVAQLGANISPKQAGKMV
ncbi:MAG: hypothetical protein MJ109_00165 [Kiritimatiellae bacterium]|nr:hypothetical protein [Kiritimatiellia bacterium]